MRKLLGVLRSHVVFKLFVGVNRLLDKRLVLFLLFKGLIVINLLQQLWMHLDRMLRLALSKFIGADLIKVVIREVFAELLAVDWVCEDDLVVGTYTILIRAIQFELAWDLHSEEVAFNIEVTLRHLLQRHVLELCFHLHGFDIVVDLLQHINSHKWQRCRYRLVLGHFLDKVDKQCKLLHLLVKPVVENFQEIHNLGLRGRAVGVVGPLAIAYCVGLVDDLERQIEESQQGIEQVLVFNNCSPY